jgi:hypothetical protein
MTSTNELEEFIKWSYPRDIVEVDDEDFLNELSMEMQCLLHECKTISKDVLSTYLEKITISRRLSLIHLFRILTGIAKTNFEIFFSHHLVQKINNCKIKIVKSNRGKNPFALRLSILDKEVTMTVKTFADILSNQEVRENLIDFFDDKNLIKKLSIIKNNAELGGDFLKYTIRYDSRGSDAHKRGKIAEEIVRKKLEELGFERNVDFNITDWDTKVALSIRLEEEIKKNPGKKSQIEAKISELKKMQINREADIILTKQFPSLFIQSSFYGSDVASIADGTVNELDEERKLIGIANTVINNDKIEFIGLIDGPGWAYSISFQRLNRVLDAVDSHFGLRTITTKLRKTLHEKNLTCPVDFEVALMIKGGKTNDEDLIRTVNEFYNIPIITLKEELEKWKKREKFDIDGEYIKLKNERKKITKKTFVMDLAYLHADEDKSGEIVMPGKKPIKKDKINELIVSYNLPEDIELEENLKLLEEEMEIIII